MWVNMGWKGMCRCTDKTGQPRDGELIRQKAIAGCMEQGLQGCRCYERK